MGDADYGIAPIAPTREMEAPRLAYEPMNPRRYNPPIGLIGCGGISAQHLKAYKAAGFNVVALCNRTESKARDRAREFYPDAAVYSDWRQVMRRDDVEVVDVATHPPERGPIIEAAMAAGKHVLSQKPFVLDLDYGEKLIELSHKHGVKLAVNHNARWAPHFSYMRQAIKQGLIGEVLAAHLSVHWDHNWIAGTEFENVRHIVLYDFGIHWFDVVACFFGDRKARRVFASTTRSAIQKARPALLGQAMIEYEGGQASLAFDADTHYGPMDRTYVCGQKGSLTSTGKDYQEQRVTVYTADGFGDPALHGTWFPTGFHGTMAELLRAIEEKREPENSAASSLRALAVCFAAVKSADTGQPQTPGTVRKLPE